MTRVLVLGGTGSIGRLVVARLLELDDHVGVLTRDPERGRAELGPRVDLTQGDLTDVDAVRAAVSEIEAVVLTHGAPYGSGDYEDIDYGAVPTLLEALEGRRVRVALMTSIGVTGSDGSAADLLGWKRRGERLLRLSGLDFTVVRPGWFDAGTGTEQQVLLSQGDQASQGGVRREHVAETLVRALRTPSATGRTVEVFSTDGPPVTDWEATFAGTDPDLPHSPDGVHDVPGASTDDEPDRVREDLRRFGDVTDQNQATNEGEQ